LLAGTALALSIGTFVLSHNVVNPNGRTLMKKLALLCVIPTLVTLLVAGIAMSDTQDSKPAAEEPQQIVVHLSHFTDDLHRCFMAIEVATLLQKSGAEVTLFLDLEGVRLAERRQPLDMTWGSSTTPLSEHYDGFIGAEGKVVLCPHCAKSAQLGDMGLKRNAEIGTEQSLAKMLLAADKILDY
jgi:predicted peroxiredoxin